MFFQRIADMRLRLHRVRLGSNANASRSPADSMCWVN